MYKGVVMELTNMLKAGSKLLLLTAVGILLSGCSHKSKKNELLAKYVSISPDDRYLLFSHYRNGVASIYRAATDGAGVKRLTFPTTECHLNAQYSPSGRTILFLSSRHNSKKPRSNIYIMNADGSNPRRVTSQDHHITDAIFSPDGKRIYFLESGYYGHYSPIAASHPHDFDIYSINIDGSGLKRITYLEEYQMQGLSITSDGRNLLFATYELKKPDQTFHILPLSDPRAMTSFGPKGYLGKSVCFYDPHLSADDRFVAFHAWGALDRILDYELFVMDMSSRRTKQLTRIGGVVGEACFFHNRDRILFMRAVNWSKRPAIYELMDIKTDGSDLVKVRLIIPVRD
jgi:Tol biopolymer transport system component